MKYQNTIQSKLPHTPTSIFAIMSALANENGAVNLSQGFPDFPIHGELISRVEKHMRAGLNQYAPMPGWPLLRERICEKIENLYGTAYHPDKEITLTAGATQAIFTAISAMVHPGDEVIVFEPAYDSYTPTIKLNGGTVKYARLNFPDYSYDWDAIKGLINRNTRMIIINSPHNPTGSVINRQDLMELERLVRGTDIVVLSDEVYEHLIFDGAQHESVCRYPELAERSFVIGSFGKTFHATGWKCGFCVAPENLMEEFRKVHQWVVYAVNTTVQAAIAEFLEEPEHYLELGAFFQKKRDLFLEYTAGSRFKPLASKGTYFQLMDYSAISEEDEKDFAIRLTKEFGIASIPVSVFYNREENNKVLRFCFAKQDDTLKKAAEILCKI